MKLHIAYTEGRMRNNFVKNTGMSLGRKYCGHTGQHILTRLE